MAARLVRTGARQGEVRRLAPARVAARFRIDHLLRGSFFLMATTGVTAILGF